MPPYSSRCCTRSRATDGSRDRTSIHHPVTRGCDRSRPRVPAVPPVHTDYVPCAPVRPVSSRTRGTVHATPSSSVPSGRCSPVAGRCPWPGPAPWPHAWDRAPCVGTQVPSRGEAGPSACQAVFALSWFSSRSCRCAASTAALSAAAITLASSGDKRTSTTRLSFSRNSTSTAPSRGLTETRANCINNRCVGFVTLPPSHPDPLPPSADRIGVTPWDA